MSNIWSVKPVARKVTSYDICSNIAATPGNAKFSTYPTTSVVYVISNSGHDVELCLNNDICVSPCQQNWKNGLLDLCAKKHEEMFFS